MDFLTLALHAAMAAPSADNSQPWRLHWDGRRISVCYREHPGVDPFGPGGHATLVGIGAVAENLCQTVVGSGCGGVDWGVGAGKSPYLSFELGATTPAGSFRPEDLPLFMRHTNRLPYAARKMEVGMAHSMAAIEVGAARIHVLAEVPQIRRFGEISRLCCQARFCNQELHDWLMGSLRFSPAEVAAGDGLDVKTLHLPPGGGWFMKFVRDWRRMEVINRLGAYRLMAMAEVRPLQTAAAIVCVVGSDTPRGALDAGRAMERVWIMLNQAGWAVQPYYVVVDQETRLIEGRLPSPWVAPVADAIGQLPDILELGGGERLHMALRVGWPAHIPVRSRRLPMDVICSEGELRQNDAIGVSSPGIK